MNVSPFSIDAIIVYVFILLTLIVGLRAGRGVKDIKDYAIGNRRYGTIGLLCTYLATNFAGSFNITTQAGLTYSEGLIAIVALSGTVFEHITTGLFIAPHAIKFTNCLTMGDIMKKLYGKHAGIITGILGSLAAIMLVGMELTALGMFGSFLLGIPTSYIVIIGGITLTVYSAHGGIKSVVATDILQFIMILIGIPLIAYLVVNQCGGIENIITSVPVEKLKILEHESFANYLFLFLTISIFPIGIVDAALVQRMLMGRKASHLRKQYFTASIFDFFSKIIMMLIGLGGFLLYQNSGIDSNFVTLHITNDLLPMGIKGLAIAGFFAVIMSTADSFLHIAGLSMVHDVLKPTLGKNIDSLHTKERLYTQMITVVLGGIAISIGLSTTDLFSLFLDTLDTTGPILMFPLFSGMMGLKTDKISFYVAMVFTIIVWLCCKFLVPDYYSNLTLLLSIVANGISFFGTHIIRNKGIAIVKSQKQSP